MNKLEISETQIVPIKPQDGLVAFASCVVNSQFYIGNIAIYTSPSSPNGFRLVYPSKSLSNGSKLSIVHPINRDTGSTVQRKIVGEYLKIIENLTKGESKDEQKSKSA